MERGLENVALQHFRTAIGNAYGDRAERVILFGSRARGDAHPDSDYDIAVFLRDMDDRMMEINRLVDITTRILYDDGEFIHAVPYSADCYNDESMPLMQGIRVEGIDL